MKALTICQPYAQLIVRGGKRVENREWATRYRGPLAIHAGKSREWLSTEEEVFFSDTLLDPLIFGAVIGEAILVDCLHIDRVSCGQYDAKYPWLRGHKHTVGTWCWILSDVRRRTDPLPWKGAQGLWDIPDAAL